MNKKKDLITKEQLRNDFIEDQGIVQTEIDESLLDKWIDDALDDLELPEHLCDYVELIPIKNYKAQYPDHLRIICEVAYREKRGKEDCKVIGHQITQFMDRTPDGCEVEINLICPKCHKTECSCNSQSISIDIDYIEAASHPEWYYAGDAYRKQFMSVGRFGYGKSTHSDEFILMTAVNDPWSQIKHLPNCANVHCKGNKCHYSCRKGCIETNIKEGWLLLSYLGTEYRDGEEREVNAANKDIVRAVGFYLQWKYFHREYQMKREAPSKQMSAEGFQMWEEFSTRWISHQIVPPADELMTYWGDTKFARMENAYCNILEGKCGTNDYQRRNIYKTRRYRN